MNSVVVQSSRDTYTTSCKWRGRRENNFSLKFSIVGKNERSVAFPQTAVIILDIRTAGISVALTDSFATRWIQKMRFIIDILKARFVASSIQFYPESGSHTTTILFRRHPCRCECNRHVGILTAPLYLFYDVVFINSLSITRSRRVVLATTTTNKIVLGALGRARSSLTAHLRGTRNKSYRLGGPGATTKRKQQQQQKISIRMLSDSFNYVCWWLCTRSVWLCIREDGGSPRDERNVLTTNENANERAMDRDRKPTSILSNVTRGYEEHVLRLYFVVFSKTLRSISVSHIKRR